MRLRETNSSNSQSQFKRRPTGLPPFELSQITEEDPPGISREDETAMIATLINGVGGGGDGEKVNCSDMVLSRVTTRLGIADYIVPHHVHTMETHKSERKLC